MSDTLKISGKFYADVAGFKATDDSDVVQTYIRPQGSTTISSNGTDIDVTQYATVTVNVSTGSTINNQNKTVTPTESQQTVTYDVDSNNYTGLGTVTINAISPTYIGSGITQNDSSDLTVSGATVTAPAGYYSTAASKSIAAMTLPTSASSSATSGATNKATISRSTSAQYINIPVGYNDTAVYYTISATPNGSVTAPSSISGTTATVSTGTNTLTLTKTVSVTPNVTTAGYISSGTAGNSSVSLTANVTVNPTPTASGATVTIPAGYYSSQTTKSVSNGSVTAPASISGTSATVSTGTNTLTLTKTISVTPSVSAGYISSGTAGNSSVSLTASVTTKGAATITPGTSDQTIASGTYLTGTQTIAGDADLVAGNIKSGVQIFGVTGTYAGASATAQSKTATPTTVQQIVTPDSGYDYLSQVTVESIPYSEVLNYADGYTATIGAVQPIVTYQLATLNNGLTANGGLIPNQDYILVGYGKDSNNNDIATVFVPKQYKYVDYSGAEEKNGFEAITTTIFDTTNSTLGLTQAQNALVGIMTCGQYIQNNSLTTYLRLKNSNKYLKANNNAQLTLQEVNDIDNGEVRYWHYKSNKLWQFGKNTDSTTISDDGFTNTNNDIYKYMIVKWDRNSPITGEKEIFFPMLTIGVLDTSTESHSVSDIDTVSDAGYVPLYLYIPYEA